MKNTTSNNLNQYSSGIGIWKLHALTKELKYYDTMNVKYNVNYQ
jgi:hypothetical protein